jgi:NADH-quinone oxidoreductase subunit C
VEFEGPHYQKASGFFDALFLMRVIDLLLLKFPKVQIKTVEQTLPMELDCPFESLTSIATELQQNPTTYFDQLIAITGLDNGPETNTLEVIYTLNSIPFNQSIMLKVVLPRNNPEIESVASIWKSANWLEREVFDMYGIRFLNHPDLRRILMPADWDGFPLRKDYKEQETYRDIKLAPEN